MLAPPPDCAREAKKKGFFLSYLYSDRLVDLSA